MASKSTLTQQATGQGLPPEAGEGKGQIFPGSLQKEHDPDNTLILAQWYQF